MKKPSKMYIEIQLDRHVNFNKHSHCFTKLFFQDCMRHYFKDDTFVVKSAKHIVPPNSSNINPNKYIAQTDMPLGIQHYQLTYLHQNKEFNQSIITKSKVTEDEYNNIIANAFDSCGIKPKSKTLLYYIEQCELNYCNRKELSIYSLQKHFPILKTIQPTFFGASFSPDNHKQNCCLILSELPHQGLSLDPFDLSLWTENSINYTISSLAIFHSIFYDKLATFKHYDFCRFDQPKRHPKEFRDYWFAIADAAALSDIVSVEDDHFNRHLIDTIPSWYSIIENQPLTIIQNDCVPKNIAHSNKNAFIYDFEVCRTHIPQRDSIELLCYVLPNQFDKKLLF